MQAISLKFMRLMEFSFDTTASSLALTCYYLARYPDVQKKLYEEIDEIFGSSDDSHEVHLSSSCS